MSLPINLLITTLLIYVVGAFISLAQSLMFSKPHLNLPRSPSASMDWLRLWCA